MSEHFLIWGVILTWLLADRFGIFSIYFYQQSKRSVIFRINFHPLSDFEIYSEFWMFNEFSTSIKNSLRPLFH